jgi:hypothetical protein
VRLTVRPANVPTRDFQVPDIDSLPITAGEIYRDFFHGPAYQVIERVGVAGSQCVALLATDLPPNTFPDNAESLLAPRLVEACFQAAGLWHTRVKNAEALPLGFASAKVYRQPAEAEGRRLYCLCETGDDGATFDASVVDEAGNVFVELRGYHTVSRPA